MMGKSHRLGGAVAMMGTFEYLRYNGLLIPDVHPLMQLAIMYPASAFGAVVPDVDHHKGSNPVNTPMGEIFHYVVHFPTRLNKRFNMKKVGTVQTGTDERGNPIMKDRLKPKVAWIDKVVPLKHRAWQTHSLIFTGSLLFLLSAMSSYFVQTSASLDAIILNMMVQGFVIGVLSHLLLDAMTTDGIFLLMYKKIRIVPSNPYFKAGGKFETVIFKRVATFSMWLLVIFTASGLIGYEPYHYIEMLFETQKTLLTSLVK